MFAKDAMQKQWQSRHAEGEWVTAGVPGQEDRMSMACQLLAQLLAQGRPREESISRWPRIFSMDSGSNARGLVPLERLTRPPLAHPTMSRTWGYVGRLP